MLVIGIETACDDSAVAIVEDGTNVLSNVVWSQRQIHERFGGVVPELAARRHAEVITSVIDEALKKANLSASDIDAIAVNNQHGLLRSVIVGVMAAKGLAIGLSKPFLGVHHVEGHVYSAILTDPTVPFPHVCLAVAGGHNLLMLVRGIGDYELLGRSLDDAAGEAFDKVAKELGLGFPGGPQVDKLARTGRADRFRLPRPLIGRAGYNFSFSGLKTATRDLIHSFGATLTDLDRADIAAAFQAAVVDVLTTQLLKAARDLHAEAVTVVGGVAANSELRTRLVAAASEAGLRVTLAAPQFCTDNAAMIAGLAFHRLSIGETSPITLNAFPNAPLGVRSCVY